MNTTAENIAYDVKYLINHGATASNIYVINLPNLGITPEATNNAKDQSSFKVKLFTAFSTAFNQALETLIKPTRAHIISAESFFNQIVENKYIQINNKKYFFSNTTQSACNFNGPNALTCVPVNYSSGTYSKYLFAGKVHPSSYTHMLLSKYISSKILTYSTNNNHS